MKYSYFPGCTLESTAKEYADSAKAICEALDVELIEIPGWNCCGEVDALYSYKPQFSIALAARNLALAEKAHMDVVTLCTSCHFTLSRTNMMLKDNPALKSTVDEALKSIGLSYSGNVKVRHLIEVLLSDVGLQKIKDKVKVPLTNFKIASYYGCFLVRPPDLINFDNPEHPSRLENLVEALGASKVDYNCKTRCCGASLAVTDEKIMLEMSKEILLNAKASGANCVLTACQMCQFNLDAKQPDVESYSKVKIDMPILYFTQLMGLAFGISPKQLGMNKNCVSPKIVYASESS